MAKGGFDMESVEKGQVKDKHGKPCPENIVALLRKAGIVSFSCRAGGVDWEVVGDDIEALLSRQETKKVS